MKATLLLAALFIASLMNAQDLKELQWKYRVVMVIDTNRNSKPFQEQVENLKKAAEGCEERQLVIYQVLPDETFTHFFDGTPSTKYQNASQFYEDFKTVGQDFKVLLIGLDGSIKEERFAPITSKELFSIIDGMPMRRAEIRKGN